MRSDNTIAKTYNWTIFTCPISTDYRKTNFSFRKYTHYELIQVDDSNLQIKKFMQIR